MIVVSELQAVLMHTLADLACYSDEFAERFGVLAKLLGHTSEADGITAEHLMLLHQSVKVITHSVKRNMGNADIHIILLTQICDSLGGDGTDARYLYHVYADAVQILKSRFAVLIVLNKITQSVELSSEFYRIHNSTP